MVVFAAPIIIFLPFLVYIMVIVSGGNIKLHVILFRKLYFGFQTSAFSDIKAQMNFLFRLIKNLIKNSR